MELTYKQESVIAKLEDAFRSCRAAGLAFVGMESALLAYPYDELVGDGDKTGDAFVEQQHRLGQGRRVDTGGAYIDSGGW